MEDLEKDNLIFLLGASGSGKSSLVQAGLVPQLSKNRNLGYFNLVPNENPFFSFYGQVLAFVSNSPQDYKQSDAQVALLPNDRQAAVEYLAKVITTLKKDLESLWLIFIDQFEEILTRALPNERFLFIQSLSYLISYLRKSDNKSIKVVLAMRTDFLDQLMNEFPDFVVTIQSDGRKPFSYITPMTDRELKLVIKNPAATHGVNVDKDLIEEIINDFRGESRSLPLLQYTLDLLWEKDNLSDKLLNEETYKDLGGVGGALQKQAEKIYQYFESQGQGKAVEDIFIKLVTITGDGKRVSKRENKSRFKGLETIVDELIREHRLLISGRQQNTVEIAHEALISSWSRLQDWITKHEEAIILERQLIEAAQAWQKVKDNNQKAIPELWTGSKLERVLELNQVKAIAGLNETVEQFIKASVAWRDRTQREQQKQIEELNRALTESRLREQAATMPDIRRLDSLQALIKTICMAGENLDKLPHQILPPVQSQLRETMEAVRISLLLEGHENQFNCVAISPDSRWIVSGSSDNTVRVWDAQTGTLLHTLQKHKEFVSCVAISPDSQWFVSCSSDNTVRVWDIQTGTLLHTLHRHMRQVYCVAISPDSRWIVSGSGDNKLMVWDVQTETLLHILEGHKNTVSFVAISPDSRWIVSGSGDKTLRVWDAQTGTSLHTLQGYENPSEQVAAISPDSQWLVNGSDNTLKIWDARSGTLLYTLVGHKDLVSCVAISPDSQWLVSGSYDNTVRVWDARSGRLLHTLQGYEQPVKCVAISPDSQWLVSGNGDKTLRVWDARSGTLLHTLQGHESYVSCVAISADSQWLVSNSEDKTLRVWDVQSGTLLHSLQGHDYSVSCVAISPDNQWFVSGSGDSLASHSGDNTLRVWDARSGTLLYTLEEQENLITCVAISPDSQWIVSGSDDNIVKVWNAQSGRLLDILEHEGSVSCVAISADSQWLVSGSLDNTLSVWDIQTGTLLRTLEEHTREVYCVAISADNQWLVSGSADNKLMVWDVKIGRLLNISQHEGSVSCVAISPDSRWIVSGSLDKTLRVWDARSAMPLHTLRHEDYVNCVAISADSQWIVSGNYDGTLKVWDARSGTLMHTLQGHEEPVSCVAISADNQFIVSGSEDKTLKVWRASWLGYLAVCCNRLRYHPAFKNPQTEDEKRAYDIANRYVFNPQIGADELYRKAKQKITAKDYPAAVDILTLAIQLNPDHLQAYRDRTRLFGHLQQYYRAIQECDRILEIHPDDADITYTRGLCYAKLDKLEPAQTDYQQALILYEQQGKPDSVQRMRNLLASFA